MFDKKQLFLIGGVLFIIVAVFFLSSIPGVRAFFSKLNPFGASLIPLDQKEDVLRESQIKEKLASLETRIDSFLERTEILDERLARLVEVIENEQLQKEEAEKILEEKQGELEQEDGEEEGGVCSVNINTASKEELEKITGVGPVIAQRIIEARPFSSLSDLIRVNGIGEITLQKIRGQGCAFVAGGVGGGFGSSGGGGGGGGTNPPPFPTILISEIQIAPTGDRFIELYNPNIEPITLTDWYLQRKTATGTSWSSLVTSTQFEGKTIQAQSHFLIARITTFNPDILLSGLTLTEDNTIRLRNPNQETADLVGWGQAQEFETSPAQNPLSEESIGRKWNEANQSYQDTNNNSADFKVQKPSPRKRNQSILGLPVLDMGLGGFNFASQNIKDSLGGSSLNIESSLETAE